MRSLVSLTLGVLLLVASPLGAQVPAAPAIPAPPAVSQTVTFDEAVRTALERHPNAARAAQAILRAEAILQSTRSVFQPTVNGTVTTTILNEARGFEGQITQPQTQSAFGVQAAYPVLAASRWAQRTRAEHFPDPGVRQRSQRLDQIAGQ
jgi:outer membrane protein TolC